VGNRLFAGPSGSGVGAGDEGRQDPGAILRPGADEEQGGEHPEIPPHLRAPCGRVPAAEGDSVVQGVTGPETGVQSRRSPRDGPGGRRAFVLT